jgi:uncharacterized membrane protein
MKSTALFFLLFICIFSTSQVKAQVEAAAQTQATDSTALPLQLHLPAQPAWSHLQEGQKIEFNLKTTGGTGSKITYALVHGKAEGMELDSTGRFTLDAGL